MMNLQAILDASTARHRGTLCPRQILGARMGMFAAELFGVALPQTDKRFFAFVETDGCMVDGVTCATGCSIGSRTLRVMDYGKTAVTFVDTLSERAIRIIPHPTARTRARDYASSASDRWHAQLIAYQIMPDAELLQTQPVRLNVSLSAIISRHGHRVICENCGEDIINEREVYRGSKILCRACAGDTYYTELPCEFSNTNDEMLAHVLTAK